MKKLSILALSVVFLGAFASVAKDSPKANQFRQTLAAVPAPELPAKSAELIKAARTQDRETITVQVVKAAVGINPAAAPAIVGAIARTVPDMAALAAATAASEQPKQASLIARAAVAAAPTKAGKIVTLVCAAVPNDYRAVAVAVAQVVPAAGTEILNAVATALPDLKPYIEKTLAGSGNSPSVAVVLDPAKVPQSAPTVENPLLSVSAPRLARGPAIGPPYIPLSSTPTNVPPGNSGEVPPGGRDYAAP